MGLIESISSRIPRIYRTMFGMCLVKTVHLNDGSLARVMQLGGVYQSATYLDDRRFDPVFSYYYAFDQAFDCGLEPHRILMVGGGGYSWPKHVAFHHRGAASLDVVEIDPAITSVARKHFYLDECMGRFPGCIYLFAGDGRRYISDCDDSKYDCIVLDAFSGCEPVISLATVECSLEVRRVLTDDGVLLANVVSSNGGLDLTFLRRVVGSYRQAFEHVYVAQCEEDPFAVEDNYLLFATNGPWKPEGYLPYDETFPLEPLYDEN